MDVNYDGERDYIPEPDYVIPTSLERKAYRRVLWAGVFLGLGFGGFFDGIVFHQLLQWHHMLTSAGLPPDTVHNLELNVRDDIGPGPAQVAWDMAFLAWGAVMLVGGWLLARRRVSA